MAQAKTHLSPLLTVRDVARLVGVAPKTIYEQRAANRDLGALGFRLGNQVRFDPDDVAAYIESQREAERRERAARADAVAGR